MLSLLKSVRLGFVALVLVLGSGSIGRAQTECSQYEARAILDIELIEQLSDGRCKISVGEVVSWQMHGFCPLLPEDFFVESDYTAILEKESCGDGFTDGVFGGVVVQKNGRNTFTRD